jgi:cytochrome c oxidase subunit II
VAGTDLTILIAYAVAVVLSVLAAFAIVVSTRGRRRATDTEALAEFEKRWLVIVTAILVALLAATIWFTPYGHSTPSNAQVVHVNAQQFFWQISPAKVKVGRPVAFVTRSTDVNHGFGIFKGHKFIAQIQVVPNEDSTLDHTFHETGTYTVLCLEFCGLNHHGMVSSFEVTK